MGDIRKWVTWKASSVLLSSSCGSQWLFYSCPQMISPWKWCMRLWLVEYWVNLMTLFRVYFDVIVFFSWFLKFFFLFFFLLSMSFLKQGRSEYRFWLGLEKKTFFKCEAVLPVLRKVVQKFTGKFILLQHSFSWLFFHPFTRLNLHFALIHTDSFPFLHSIISNFISSNRSWELVRRLVIRSVFWPCFSMQNPDDDRWDRKA